MNFDDANKYISITLSALSYVLDKESPDAIISVTIDSYILHILYILCKKRDINFIGLIPSFIRGYFRITAIGEHLAIRDVNESEVNEVTKFIYDPEYKPSYLVRSASEMKRRAIKAWAANAVKPIYFSAKSVIPGNKFNYHYQASKVVSLHYRSFIPTRYIGVGLDEIQKLINKHDNNYAKVFLPLQMSPECTVDYWSSDTKWIDYEEKTLNLIDEHSENVIFYVKEHPNLLGYRSANFYRFLAERPNCILIAPEVSSNIILPLFDAVVICTGSVGLEAALRGVPVFSDCEPFHLPASHVIPLSKLATLNINPILPIDPNNVDRNYLVNRLLQGLLPGRFVNDGSWDAKRISDVEAGRAMAQEISAHLPRIVAGEVQSNNYKYCY